MIARQLLQLIKARERVENDKREGKEVASGSLGSGAVA